MERLTAFAGKIEITSYNEDNSVTNRALLDVAALEAQIPPAVQEWLLAEARRGK